MCPRVGGTLRPTLENSSGQGWVVQEEPATTSCRTSTSGENDPAACLWSSFTVGIINFKGFRDQGWGETIWGGSARRDLEISNLKCKCEAAVACCILPHHSAACSLFTSNPRRASMTHAVTFDPLDDTGTASGGWLIQLSAWCHTFLHTPNLPSVLLFHVKSITFEHTCNVFSHTFKLHPCKNKK